MKLRASILSTVASVMLGALAGCSHNRSAAPPTTQLSDANISIGPATPINTDPKAALALEEIEPKPLLADMKSATQPGDKPPLEALELYAKARDAIATQHRFTAISLLERALALDPNSPELYRMLSRAYQQSANPAKATDALRRACELDPNNGRSQCALGRLYLLRNEPIEALVHLRLAAQTRDYARDEASAAITDYLLARTLQQLGYDRAAIDEYEKLIARLHRPTIQLRGDRELNEWIAQPEAVFADLARLYERRGQYQHALEAWRAVADHDADDFDARSHAINMLLALGRKDEALAEAADAVRRTGASSRSLELLSDVSAKIGKRDAVFDELGRLHRERPNDLAILFSYSDLLASAGRAGDAERVLADAAREKWNLEVVQKLLHYYSDRRRNDEATKLLIETAAARPDSTAILLSWFRELLEPFQLGSVRATTVQKIVVPSAAEPAKQLFLSVAANKGRRTETERDALNRAATLDPIFAPALRKAVDSAATRTDIELPEKFKIIEALYQRAANDPALLAELRGLAAANDGQRGEAIRQFEMASKFHHLAPDAALVYGNLLREANNNARFEQLMWQVISDFPESDDAYDQLLRFQANSGGANAAAAERNIVQRWLNSNPLSARARFRSAELALQEGRTEEALRDVSNLVHQYPNNPTQLETARQFYALANQAPQYMNLLQSILKDSPMNIAAGCMLMRLEIQSGRAADAEEVLDSMLPHASGDTDALYTIGQFYEQLNATQKAQEVLERASLDTSDPRALNDLGYMWLNEGRNIDRSEAMIRRALEIEPDNAAFLDSLGWVYYKRGQFGDARKYLAQAIRASADAEVLDHLGDTLFRLNEPNDARVQWQRALDRSMQVNGSSQVRQSVLDKITQLQSGARVSVAPILTEVEKVPATNPAQALKNQR